MSVRSSIAVLAVVALVGLLVYGLVSKGSSRIAVGEQAPTTALPRLEGVGGQAPSKPLSELKSGAQGSLAQYKGRWVLVNFWASWCIPCRQEAPTLEAFQRQHGGPKFTVLGIDTRDLSDDGRAFAQRYELSYPQLRDGNGDAAHSYGTTGVPENFLVDPSGIVRWELPGPVDEQYLHEQVEPFLPKVKS